MGEAGDVANPGQGCDHQASHQVVHHKKSKKCNKQKSKKRKKSTQMQSAKDATRLRLMPGVYLTLEKHFDFPIVLLVTLGYMRWL